MRRFTAVVAVALAWMASAHIAAQAKDPIPVFVYGREDASGFVSAESKIRADLAIRVARRLKSREIAIVDRLGEARLSVQITDCDLRVSDDQGAIAVPIGTMVAVVPTRDSWWTVHAWVSTGGPLGMDKIFPFSVVARPSCENGDKRLTNDLRAWIRDNQDRLRQTPTIGETAAKEISDHLQRTLSDAMKAK